MFYARTPRAIVKTLADSRQPLMRRRIVVTVKRRENAMRIREAIADDSTSIAHIYNQGIEDRMATLETQPRTQEERADWLVSRSSRHPVIVAVDESGKVTGWASLNSFNPRPAY